MKKCIRCMELKDESEFNIRSKERCLLQSVCRNCQREQGRERYINDTENVKAINRAARQRSKGEARQFVHVYLSDKACSDCGESDFSVLTFDHVRGKKKTNISDMISQGYSIASLESELEKTEIVCFNCQYET